MSLFAAKNPIFGAKSPPRRVLALSEQTRRRLPSEQMQGDDGAGLGIGQRMVVIQQVVSAHL